MGLKAIGINIYGGGFTLGVLKHFEVLGQWEEIKLGMKTFDLNFKGIYRPLELNQWPVEAYADYVDFVYANPPCTPWSNSGNYLGRTKSSRFYDNRLKLTQHTMEAALELRPKVFISESVEGAYNIGKNHYDQFRDEWMAQGYSVTYFLNDAILQGAPCVRRRFHFIAHKDKLQLDLPEVKIRSVKDAIGDLVEIDGRILHHEFKDHRPHVSRIVHKVPEYGSVQKIADASPEYDGPKFNFFIRKLAWNYPAPTMVGFEFIHPLRNSWITYREALRLCTYPDSFKIHQPVEAVDAVLPVVSEFLALTAKKTILKAESQEKTFEVVDWRPLAKPFHFKKPWQS